MIVVSTAVARLGANYFGFREKWELLLEAFEMAGPGA